MISLPIISLVACTSYILYIIFKFGIPVSISETYYILDEKWDWLFSAWCVLTGAPLGFYWYTVAPDNLKWIPIVTVIAMLFVSVSRQYKSGSKCEHNIVSGDQPGSNTYESAGSAKQFLKNIASRFQLKEFLKYGWARPIHYFNSLLLMGLTTAYILVIDPSRTVMLLTVYAVLIILGIKIDGVYNEHYSADVDNKAWVFMLEIACLINIFSFFL